MKRQTWGREARATGAEAWLSGWAELWLPGPSEPHEALANLVGALRVWTGSRSACGLSGCRVGIYRNLYSEGVSEGKPMEWGPKTHRRAQWRHTSVAGTDGQVVKGNSLPIQLHILPDTQHPLHRRDHKLPWVLPKGGWG